MSATIINARADIFDEKIASERASPTHTTATATAATTTHRKKRRSWKILGFISCVIIPTAVAGGYLYGWSANQYVSEFRFSVRQQRPMKAEGAGMASALGGSNPLLAVMADSEVVVQYLRSRQAVDDIGARIDLNTIWSRPADDWVFRLDPSATAEAKLRHWRQAVDPFFDLTTGVVTVKVRAFSPEDALSVASESLAAAERRVNEMSGRAHQDALAYAEKQATQAEERLKRAENAMAMYRNKNSVMFPQMQANTVNAVEGKLREQLAESRTTLASLRTQGVQDISPQIRTLQSRIEATEREISNIQSGVGHITGEQKVAGAGELMPTTLASVMNGYSPLEVEERISEKAYGRALDSLQDARNEASQQQVYLDAFVRPSEAQESLYPVRWKALIEIAIAGFATWCLGMMVIHGIRDHMD